MNQYNLFNGEVAVNVTSLGTTKRCSTCGAFKTVNNFYINSTMSDGYNHSCKKCQLDYQNRRNKNPNRIIKSRKHMLKNIYGITQQDYDRMHEQQNGKCAICGSTYVGRRNAVNFAVDHDHKTGKIRGLLCGFCNKGLGHFKDNTEHLKSAISYLNKNS